MTVFVFEGKLSVITNQNIEPLSSAHFGYNDVKYRLGSDLTVQFSIGFAF